MSTQSETTNVTGYFNPNSWPIALNSSRLGFNNFIVQGGHFVTDPQKRQYNDPLLESFVGPQVLAREVSDVPVPIYRLPVQNTTPPPAGSPGFTGSRTIPESMRPQNPVNVAAARKAANLPVRTATIMERPATPQSPNVSAASFEGMTMAEAKRRGLVAGVTTPAPEGLPDDDSREVAKSAPTIGITRDGARRVLRDQPVVAQPVVSAPPPPKNSIGATLAEAAQINPEAEDPIAEAMRVRGTLENDVEVQRAPTAVMSSPPPSRVKPVVVPPLVVPQMSSLESLPEPNLSGQPAPEPPRRETKRFVCSVDGRAFDYRWQLVKHIEKKYPGREGELLAGYPPSPQALAKGK